jgi:hypothetical protein
MWNRNINYLKNDAIRCFWIWFHQLNSKFILKADFYSIFIIKNSKKMVFMKIDFIFKSSIFGHHFAIIKHEENRTLFCVGNDLSKNIISKPLAWPSYNRSIRIWNTKDTSRRNLIIKWVLLDRSIKNNCEHITEFNGTNHFNVRVQNYWTRRDFCCRTKDCSEWKSIN